MNERGNDSTPSNADETSSMSGTAIMHKHDSNGSATQELSELGARTSLTHSEGRTATRASDCVDQQEHYPSKGVPVRALVSNLTTLQENMLVKYGLTQTKRVSST